MSEEYRELLIGCGRARDKRVRCPSNMTDAWKGLVTLDVNVDVAPDIVADLDREVWQCLTWSKSVAPLMEKGERYGWLRPNTFDEIHAYEVIEHLGSQGDHVSFFAFFWCAWDILKPGGFLAGTVPSRYSPWLWGDPGHRRAILPESLIFLSQMSYKQCDDKASVMSDYRSQWSGDFDRIRSEDDRTMHRFLLQAVKPARVRNATP